MQNEKLIVKILLKNTYTKFKKKMLHRYQETK